jgi:hypothetical protein
MSENYDKLKRPPSEALKTIKGGRINGMTDIKPQWRYEIMDTVYGPCGDKWKFEIVRLWLENGSKDQIAAFAQVNVYVKYGDAWSEPIPGVGGSMFVTLESAGLHTSDEAFKMAITDALSTSLKMLGVAADIHMGMWDGTKYKDAPPDSPKSPAAPPKKPDTITPEEMTALKQALIDHIAAGNFEHPDNVQAVMDANAVGKMRAALEAAKSNEARRLANG